MNGARITTLVILLAVGVAVVDQGLVRLVEASGARDEPATLLVLLLSAFLGLLTAMVGRALNLPGALTPTALVVAWIIVPPVMQAIPGDAGQIFSGTAELDATEAISLAVAVISAAATLAISGRGD